MEIQNNDLGGVDLFNTAYDDAVIKFAGNVTYAAGSILAVDPSDNTMIPFKAQGSGARFNVTTAVAGVITVIAIAAAGKKYAVGDVLPLSGGSGAGSGAIVTVSTIDANGAITAVAISSGGIGYVTADTGLLDQSLPSVASKAAAVMRDAITKTGGAGNVQARVIVSGQVRTEKLAIYAGIATIDAAVKEALRQTGIVALSTTELAFEDNQ